MDLWPGNLDRIICRWLCNPAILNSIFLSLSILNPKSKISTDKVITYCPSSTGCNVILFKFLLWVVKFKIISQFLPHIGKAALVTSTVCKNISLSKQLMHNLKCIRHTFILWSVCVASWFKILLAHQTTLPLPLFPARYQNLNTLPHLWQLDVGSALRWRKYVTYWLLPNVFRLR